MLSHDCGGTAASWKRHAIDNSIPSRSTKLLGEPATPKDEAGSVPRVAAPEIEAIVLKTLRETEEREEDLSERELVHERLAKVVVRTGRLEISLTLSNDAEPKRLDLPWSAPASRRKREIVGPPAEGPERRPMRAEAPGPAAGGDRESPPLPRRADRWRFTSTAEIARHERCSERSVRITLCLAFLTPAVVRAAVEDRLPYGLNTSSFSELPILWEEQLHIAS